MFDAPVNLVESDSPFYFAPRQEEPLTVNINGKSYILSNKTIGVAKDSLDCANLLNNVFGLLEEASNHKGTITDYTVKIPGRDIQELNKETINEIRMQLFDILEKILAEDVIYQNSKNTYYSMFPNKQTMPPQVATIINGHKEKLNRYSRMIENIRNAVVHSISNSKSTKNLRHTMSPLSVTTNNHKTMTIVNQRTYLF